MALSDYQRALKIVGIVLGVAWAAVLIFMIVFGFGPMVFTENALLECSSIPWCAEVKDYMNRGDDPVVCGFTSDIEVQSWKIDVYEAGYMAIAIRVFTFALVLLVLANFAMSKHYENLGLFLWWATFVLLLVFIGLYIWPLVQMSAMYDNCKEHPLCVKRSFDCSADLTKDDASLASTEFLIVFWTLVTEIVVMIILFFVNLIMGMNEGHIPDPTKKDMNSLAESDFIGNLISSAVQRTNANKRE
jgi:hypothetical protein